MCGIKINYWYSILIFSWLTPHSWKNIKINWIIKKIPIFTALIIMVKLDKIFKNDSINWNNWGSDIWINIYLPNGQNSF